MNKVGPNSKKNQVTYKSLRKIFNLPQKAKQRQNVCNFPASAINRKTQSEEGIQYIKRKVLIRRSFGFLRVSYRLGI